jgi:hypothetical protein
MIPTIRQPKPYGPRPSSNARRAVCRHLAGRYENLGWRVFELDALLSNFDVDAGCNTSLYGTEIERW